MSNIIHTHITNAVTKILRPLVRILLRNGISVGNFEELARKAFVDEAFAEARRHGEKATVSSISAQTGLSRKEVKRLNELSDPKQSDSSQKYNRAIRVISGWLNDSRFITDQGLARVLPVDGGNHSFAQLVKDYSGDIPTRAMLNLLESAGSLETVDGHVYLISHAYVPGNDSVDILDILGNDCNELISTIDHNLTCEADNKRFQRKVSTTQLSKDHIDPFQLYANQRSQALLEELDNWLSQHEATNNNDAQYVSLGIYFYENDPLEDNEQ